MQHKLLILIIDSANISHWKSVKKSKVGVVFGGKIQAKLGPMSKKKTKKLVFQWVFFTFCVLACSPRVNQEIFRVSLLKSALPFLTNKIVRFISCGIDRSYFSGNFLLSFFLWYNFKILVESRDGGIFLCLASSANVWQKFFFSIES